MGICDWTTRGCEHFKRHDWKIWPQHKYSNKQEHWPLLGGLTAKPDFFSVSSAEYPTLCVTVLDPPVATKPLPILSDLRRGSSGSSWLLKAVSTACTWRTHRRLIQGAKQSVLLGLIKNGTMAFRQCCLLHAFHLKQPQKHIITWQIDYSHQIDPCTRVHWKLKTAAIPTAFCSTTVRR